MIAGAFHRRLIHRLTACSSSDSQILRGFVFSFVFLFLAKIGGGAKEVVLAHAYGTSISLDAYALGFAISSWPVTIGAMCANTMLIPTFVEALRAPDEGQVNVPELLARLIPLVASVATAIYLLLRYAAPELLPSPKMAGVLSTQAAGLALMVPFGIAAAVLASRLMAGQRQISALFEAIPSLFVALCVLIFGKVLPAGPLLAWATGIGMFFYVVVLVLIDRSVLCRPVRSHVRASNMRRTFAVILVAQIVFTLGGAVFDQVVAAGLPKAQNAPLAYANRLLMLVTGLGATAIGRAVMPVLSGAWVTDSLEGKRLLHRWFVVLFAGGALAAMVAYPLIPAGVRLLFEHGHFTASDTREVSSLVRIGVIQFPFYFSSLILAQGAVVQRRFWHLLLANVLAISTKGVLVVFFLRQGGVGVLLYSTAAMYFVSLAVLGSSQFFRRD